MLDRDTNSAQLARLLAQTGQGNAAAFRQLYHLTSPRLYQCALRVLGSRETAEEVLQESFIGIWRDAASFDASRAAPLTWMVAVVRHKAVDWLRANHRRHAFTGGEAGPEAEPQCGIELDPCASVERQQRRQQIEQGLNGLHSLHREAIELCFFKELSHAEVASEMTLPLGTVKTWIRRGCQQMRQVMERRLA